MFVSLTTIFILALGKILCQAQVSQEVKYLPSPFVPGRTVVQQTLQDSRSAERSTNFVNKINCSATTQRTTNSKQKPKLFISRLQSRQMDQKRPFENTATTNNTITSSSNAQNITRDSTQISTNDSARDNVYDKIVFKDEGVLMESNSVKSDEPAAGNGSTSHISRPPDSVTEVPSPANVTLEDRGAFDGDACPTGYVRVNGVCVIPE